MDTSEQYIEMCRKATELQEMWEPSLGDFYYSDFSKLVCVMSDHMQFNRDKLKEYSDAIWLPRIDQLIELSGMGWYNFMLFGVRIADHAGVFMQPMQEHFIMCLMHYKYKKKWNGEDWI